MMLYRQNKLILTDNTNYKGSFYSLNCTKYSFCAVNTTSIKMTLLRPHDVSENIIQIFPFDVKPFLLRVEQILRLFEL